MSFAQNIHREEINAALVSSKPNDLLGKPTGFESLSGFEIRVFRVIRVPIPLPLPGAFRLHLADRGRTEPAELNPGGISYEEIVRAIRISIVAGRCNWRAMS